MTYRIIGEGAETITSTSSDLLAAARTASKMEDQGLSNVRVFAPSGKEISRDKWEAAWWGWAN
jgi:hypothetical protein